MTICPHCNQSHPEDAEFCPTTGNSITLSLDEDQDNGTASKLFLILGIIIMFLGIGSYINLKPKSLGTSMESETEISTIVSPTQYTPDPNSRSSENSILAPTETLRPTKTITSIPSITQTQISGEWEPCPNSYVSRLHVGDKAHVSYEPPLPNRVRSQPNTNSAVLGRIQPGETVNILQGPKCGQGWVWWKIQSISTGMKGWTSEGDNNDYWLIPDQ